MLRDAHAHCQDHVSIAFGAVYCPAEKSLLVRPDVVMGEGRGGPLQGNMEAYLISIFFDLFAAQWPQEELRDVQIVHRSVPVKGMFMDCPPEQGSIFSK